MDSLFFHIYCLLALLKLRNAYIWLCFAKVWCFFLNGKVFLTKNCNLPIVHPATGTCQSRWRLPQNHIHTVRSVRLMSFTHNETKLNPFYSRTKPPSRILKSGCIKEHSYVCFTARLLSNQAVLTGHGLREKWDAGTNQVFEVSCFDAMTIPMDYRWKPCYVWLCLTLYQSFDTIQ